MIKKILITLLILIVIAVAGIVSLIVFVDPNNYKGFISATVKDKTGYELSIDGDLRWHIWPQISILTDSVRLQDEGAKKPILTADNMRLDVELLPLFSKQLSVKNILVKSAVIDITDDSKGKVARGENTQTTTINQTSSLQTTGNEQSKSSWDFTLNQLDIVDSTVVFQQNKKLINFRDINISVVQKDNKNVAVDFRGNINRDQQEFVYALNADVNLANFPQSALVELHKLTYDYKGVGVPAGGLKGDVSATLKYNKSPFTLDSNNFALTMNGNKLTGSLQANLDDKPYFAAKLASDQFDLTPFLNPSATSANGEASAPSLQTAPVVSSSASGNELAFLRDFNAALNLKVKEIVANKVVANNFEVDVTNKDGIAALHKVNFDIAQGTVAASGSANGKQPTTAINLATKINNIDLGVMFAQLELVNNFKGQFNANGDISSNTIDPARVMSALKGDLSITVTKAKLENINIQNIIQSTVAQYSKDVATPENQVKYTELHELSTNAKLANGNLNLTELKARSETLNVNGEGRVGLINRDLDVNLNVKMLGGWNGKSETIQKLQKVMIPLRIYGEFTNLHYQIEADKIIKDILNDKLQQGLDKFKDRLQQRNVQKTDGTGTTDNNRKPKPADILGGLLNKLDKE